MPEMLFITYDIPRRDMCSGIIITCKAAELNQNKKSVCSHTYLDKQDTLSLMLFYCWVTVRGVGSTSNSHTINVSGCWVKERSLSELGYIF